MPAPILEFANRLLPTAAPDVRPPRSVRTTGRAPELIEDRELHVSPIVHELADLWTTVGVIVPTTVDVDVPVRDGVLVVTPAEAKGLEFDAVVVVEPAAFLDGGGDEGAALRLLYIALTRAVQVLTIVHARPLPPSLIKSQPPLHRNV